MVRRYQQLPHAFVHVPFGACRLPPPPFWNVYKLCCKLRGLLLPLLFFGFCYTLTFSRDVFSGLQGFLESPSKNGYWYLMSLAVFYVSQQVFRLNVKQKWFVDVLLALVVWGVMVVLWKLFAQEHDYFCLLNCVSFYPFFIMGSLASKYKLLDKLRNADWLFSFCVVGSLVLFCVEMPVHALESFSRRLLLPFFLVAVVTSLFMSRSEKTSRVERLMEYVGRRTLDVYVIHYFFISRIHLSVVDRWLEHTGNDILSLVLSVLLSVVVVALSLGVGNVLRHGRLIERLCYGK